jgi:hypothetical protein
MAFGCTERELASLGDYTREEKRRVAVTDYDENDIVLRVFGTRYKPDAKPPF